MNPQTAFVLMMALLAVASYGWGTLAVWSASGHHRLSSHRVRLDGPMNIAIGIALYLVVGGFAVAGNFAYFDVQVAWLCAGVAVAMVVSVKHWRERAHRMRPSWVVALTGICALAATALALAPFALARWSEADDAPAYTYLGQRLLATGGLIDPFNSRRLQNYGGAELFQSLVIKVAGTSATSAIETVFFCVLALALLIRSVRRPYAVLVIVTIGVAIVIAQPVGDMSNTGPTFSETVLLLAMARLFADNQRRAEPQGWMFLIGGVLFAALFSLRPQGVPAGVAVIAVAACFAPSFRVRLQNAAIGLVSTAVGVFGWAVALHRSSDAWVFGFAMPSWTQASWSLNPGIVTLSEHLRFLLDLTQVDSWSVGVVGAVVISLIAGALLYRTRGIRHQETTVASIVLELRLDLLLALIVGNIGLLLVFTYMGNGDASDSIGHYFAPILLALVLFSLDRVWGVVATGNGTPLPLIPILGVALTSIGYIYAFCDVSPPLFGRDVAASARASLKILKGRPFKARLGQQYEDDLNQPLYQSVNAEIPPGAYVLSGVEFPGLLDFSKFRFATVDEAYGNSPPPHLPESGDPKATVRYLEKLGFTAILAEDPNAPFYYNYANNYLYSHQPVRNYQQQDGSLVKWDDTVLKLEQLYPTTQFGDMRYISFGTYKP